MRVLLLAPGVLSRRPNLAQLVAGLTPEQRDALAGTCMTQAWAGPRRVADVPGVIHDHQVQDSSLVPATIWEGLLDLADVPEVARPVVERATVRITPHGFILLRVHVDVPRPEVLLQVEPALCQWASERFSVMGQEFASTLDRVGLTQRRLPGKRDLPEDVFLWWHRLILGVLPEAVLHRFHLDRYDMTCLRPGIDLCVGDGYSQLLNAKEEEVAGVADGLELATQLWLASDNIQRRLAEQSGRLSVPASAPAESAREREAVELSERAALETTVLLEAIRYTAGPQRQALNAASSSWQIPLDLTPLTARAEGLRVLVDRRNQLERDARQARLTRLLASLTVVSALGVLLDLFETSFGPAVLFPPQLVRALVAVAVLATGVTAILMLLRDEK